MRGEREFFGGESLDEYGKKLAKENKETEFVPWSELMTNVGEQMNKVVASLEKEREISADIRKMGGKVTRETADKIMGLEKTKNELLKIYEKTLEPTSKQNFLDSLEGETFVVPKPEQLEELMTDPEEMEITDDMVIEAQTSEELSLKEVDLRTEADLANEEMVEIIEQMSEMRQSEPLIPTGESKDMKRQTIDLLQTRFNELHNYVRAINGKLGEVRMNLSLVNKMEDKEGREAA